MKRYIVGTFVGGVSLFLLGYLTYVVLMPNRMFDGSVAAVATRSAPKIPVIIVAELLFGYLLTCALVKSGAIVAMGGAVKTGAMIGGLIALAYSLLILATTHLMTSQGVVFVAVTWAIRWGIAAAILSRVIGKENPASA